MPNGENLKTLRTLKGIPQKAMAKKMGISQAAVSKIEHSKNIGIKVTEKYMKALHFTNEEIEKLKRILPPPLNKTTHWKLCNKQ